jgi:hypothetical protein
MKSNESLNAIAVCTASQHYSALFQSLENPVQLDYKSEHQPISTALFYHLAKMRYAGWRHRVEFQRKRKHSVADFFQDMVAFYLRCALPMNEFDIKLEEPSPDGCAQKTHPDILIIRNEKPHFVVEAKTTIGWARPSKVVPEQDRYASLAQRLELIAANFKLPRENVIYVFEEPDNAGVEFRELFWNKKDKCPVSRHGLPYPLSQVFPLFSGIDPYYWSSDRKEDRRTFYDKISDDRFLNEATKRIVTPFESVVDLIRAK